MEKSFWRILRPLSDCALLVTAVVGFSSGTTIISLRSHQGSGRAGILVGNARFLQFRSLGFNHQLHRSEIVILDD